MAGSSIDRRWRLLEGRHSAANWSLEEIGGHSSALAPSLSAAFDPPDCDMQPSYAAVPKSARCALFHGLGHESLARGISGGSSITAMEVCPSNISRKFPIALVMFSLNFGAI